MSSLLALKNISKKIGLVVGSGLMSVLLMASPSLAVVGDVVVNEFMANPVVIEDGDGEWVELRNKTETEVDISDWTLNAGTSTAIIFPTGTVISPAGHYVICADDTLAEANCDVTWSGLSLSNSSADMVTLTDNNSIVVDEVSYDATVVTAGNSIEVQEDASGLKVLSTNETDLYTATPTDNTGTPGALNRASYSVVNSSNGTTYPDLQSAIDAASSGQVIELTDDVVTTTETVINKPITLDGKGFSLLPNYPFVSNSGPNSVLEVVSASDVTVKNVVIDGTNGTNIHGINIYEATDLSILDTTVANNDRAGIIINSSTVSVNNITTLNNTWYSINVDQKTSQPAVLNISGNNNQAEATAIFVDNNTKDVTVNDVDSQYTKRTVSTKDVYTKTTYAPGPATTRVISGSTTATENDPDKWFFNRDTGTATPYEFNNKQSSIGDSSVNILPISATPSDKFIAEYFMQTPIADIGAISYDFQIGDGGTAADVNEFYMNVYANFGESSLTKFYDCRYNVVPTVGVNGAFTTFTFDPFADYPVTISGSSPQPICPSSPAGMDILSPGSTLRVFALNVGDTSANDQGLDGYIDNVVVETTSATTTFDFEAPDTSGPSISEKNPGDNDVIGGTYKISAKVTDPSGVKEDSVYARFKDNDGDVITYYLEREGSTDIFSKTVNTKEFESRTKTYRRVSYRAVDLLGNSRSSVADNVVVDNNGPAITEKTPAENSIIKGIVNVRVNVNDISGVKDDSVYVRFRDAANKEFTYYLTREGTTSYFSREVDTRVFVPDGTSSGPSRVSFRAIDGLGNPRSSVSDGVTIDNAAPTITVKDNFVGDKDAKVFSNVSFKLFDKNEIDKYAINTQEVDLGNNKFSDANFQNLQSKLVEGNNTFVLFDVAGNSTTYEFIYDATAPEAPQVTAPGARQFIKGSSTLNSWTAANDDNGIKNYEVKYQFEGRPTAFRTVSSTSRTQTFTGSYQGPITISVRAQDTAGNWSEFGSEVTYNYDSITPVTTINAPTGVVNGTFTVNGSASDNIQLNRVYVQLVNRDENKRYGGTTINLIPEGSSAEWSREYNANSDGLPDGTYAAHVSVVDRAGNTSSAGWTDNFVVDSTAPDASIVTPSDNSTVSGTVSIQGIVSDENPMNSFFRIEGPNSYNQTSLFTDGRETHDYSWDTAGLDDGEYTITFETRDLALNKGAGSVTSITVTLDNTAPETTFTTVDSENTSPELSGATTEDTLSLSVEIDDKTYDAAVTGSAWVLAENTISPALTPGSYDVTVKATDATGNQSSQTFANAVTVTQPETTTPTPVGTGGGQTQGVNTGSGTPTTPSVTTPVNQQPQAVGTPTVVLAQNTQSGGIGGDNGSSNTAVLGASDVAQADESAESDVSSQNSQVLQSTTGNDSDSDELSASETDEDGCYELFGICWYWYAIPVIAIIGYGLYRGFRKED